MMSPNASYPVSANWSAAKVVDTDVCDLMQSVITTSQPQFHRPERRSHQRLAYPHLMTLTPIAEQELTVIDEPLVIVGKHLAVRGLDFYHCEPLPYRRAIVSFDEMPWDVHLVLSVSWCRFLRPGWYDSGGRFTHVVMPAAQGDLSGNVAQKLS